MTTVHTQLNNQLVTAMLIVIVMKTAAMHEDRVLHTNVSMRKNVPTSTTCRCSNHPQGKDEKLATFKDTSPCPSSSEYQDPLIYLQSLHLDAQLTFPFAAEPGLEGTFFPLEGGAGFSFSLVAAPPSPDSGDCFAFPAGCWGVGAADRCLSRRVLTTCLEAGYKGESKNFQTALLQHTIYSFAVAVCLPPLFPIHPSLPLTFSFPACFSMAS